MFVCCGVTALRVKDTMFSPPLTLGSLPLSSSACIIHGFLPPIATQFFSGRFPGPRTSLWVHVLSLWILWTLLHGLLVLKVGKCEAHLSFSPREDVFFPIPGHLENPERFEVQ